MDGGFKILWWWVGLVYVFSGWEMDLKGYVGRNDSVDSVNDFEEEMNVVFKVVVIFVCLLL